MKTVLSLAVAAVVALAPVAGSGAALASSLRDQKEVNDGLVIIAAADMIRKTCPTISARMLNAYGFMRSLKSIANDAGFSDRQIEAYVENKAEKARVEGIARAYLASQGVIPQVVETYCEVGRYEIERNSQIGVLLKEK